MLSNWQTLYLYQICQINLPSRTSVNFEGNLKTYHVIDNDCIDEKLSKITKTKMMNEFTDSKDKLKLALKGDFIICLKQNFIEGDLTAAFVEEDVLVTSNFAVLTPKEKFDPNILMWAFHQNYVISQIKPLHSGRNFFYVKDNELSKILIPVERFNSYY